MSVARAVVAIVVLGVCWAGRADDMGIVHQQAPRSPVATVTTDTLWGGLAGGAVGGAVIAYRIGLQSQQGYDWVPVLVTGVGIGLAGGFVLGIVDALSNRPTANLERPVHDGMSLRELRPTDLSGQKMLPLWAGRF